MRLLLVSLIVFSGAGLSLAEEPARQVTFKKTRLDDKFRSEGCAIGDFNHDGKPDIAAGFVYYAAPDWKLTPIVADPKTVDPHGYSESFCNFSDDVNGDGRADLIVVGFPGKETNWFEQPAETSGEWKRHLLTPVTNNESPSLLDVIGDAKRELLLGFEPGKFVGLAQPTADAASPWTLIHVSAAKAPGADRYSHGIGAGDINGDGRKDVLVAEGWWEQPAALSEGSGATAWTFHPAPFGPACAQMLVYDFDGDGDNDVITTSAHNFGVWWHEQTKDGWQTHDIDKSFSQSHSACLADINGDGLADFVTGKRWWAHGPKGDVAADQPAVLYWYELQRKDGRPEWTRHEVDNDSGVGTQFEVGDVNGDGLLDIAISNKRGAFYFEQQR